MLPGSLKTNGYHAILDQINVFMILDWSSQDLRLLTCCITMALPMYQQRLKHQKPIQFANECIKRLLEIQYLLDHNL